MGIIWNKAKPKWFGKISCNICKKEVNEVLLTIDDFENEVVIKRTICKNCYERKANENTYK